MISILVNGNKSSTNEERNEETNGENSYVVLQKYTENPMGGVIKQRWSLKENVNEKNTSIQNQNRQLKLFGHIIREEGLENLTLKGHTEGKRDKG